MEVNVEGDLMEKLVTLCKRRGFIFQSSEIYGGYNGFWDYGPYGVMLKRAVEQTWWKYMIEERDNVVGLDSTSSATPKSGKHPVTLTASAISCATAKIAKPVIASTRWKIPPPVPTADPKI